MPPTHYTLGTFQMSVFTTTNKSPLPNAWLSAPLRSGMVTGPEGRVYVCYERVHSTISLCFLLANFLNVSAEMGLQVKVFLEP